MHVIVLPEHIVHEMDQKLISMVVKESIVVQVHLITVLQFKSNTWSIGNA